MAPFARIKTSVDALGWTAVKGTILALWFTSRAAQTEKNTYRIYANKHATIIGGVTV
jgi:hypothetical protein